MRLMHFNEMEQHGHDVYEFAYGYDESSPQHWRTDSLYVDAESLWEVGPYLNRVFPAFAYYGPQRVTVEQWKAVREACLEKEPTRRAFFDGVEQWLVESPEPRCDFWILGV